MIRLTKSGDRWYAAGQSIPDHYVPTLRLVIEAEKGKRKATVESIASRLGESARVHLRGLCQRGLVEIKAGGEVGT